jgi:RNA polymerase sigma-70 factor, ECF subfamily
VSVVSSDDAVNLRPRLFGLAYRMLGSRQDAEDAVQEAFLRWQCTDTHEIRSSEGWLVRTLSRICVDRLRAMALERRTYVGPWLPEPLVGDETAPDGAVELASDLSMALLVVLERLAPEERAAFLLHDIFDCPYPEIARALGKSESACRQLVHRARERVRRDRRRFDVSEAEHRQLVERYARALQEGNAERIATLLSPDAVFTSDGGGKAWAALHPIVGASRIARMEVGVARKRSRHVSLTITSVNGSAGLVHHVQDRIVAVSSFESDGCHVHAIMRVLNPEKLAGVGAPSGSRELERAPTARATGAL